MMNISKLAKLLTQDKDRTIIATLQGLLFLMKKFWKSLNTPNILSALSQSYPEIIQLYILLGKSRCTVNQCQQLLVSVSSLLDSNHLEVSTCDNLSLDLMSDNTFAINATSDVWLTVSGKGNKIYKRTLEGDLNKLIGNY